MLGGLAILLICQLIGEVLAALLALPIPGPVIGMILLFCGLLVANGRLQPGDRTPDDDADRPNSGSAKQDACPRRRFRGSRPPHPRPLPQGLDAAAQGMLRYLALMFIPAGTGIIAYIPLIREEWLAIAVALLGSTALALGATGLVMQALAGRRRGSAPDEGDV